MVNYTFRKGKMAQIIGRRYMYLLAPMCGVLQTRSSGQFHFMICRIAWTSLKMDIKPASKSTEALVA
jgi:hypothetical protein